jgi:hypothetical protein
MKKKALLVLFYVTSYACFTQSVKVTPIFIDDSFDSVSLSKLHDATKILQNVFNSEQFRTEMLASDFRVGAYKLKGSDIYEILMTGKNNYNNSPPDGSIDLRLKVFDEYFGFGNFGVTDMDNRVTRTHRCFILHNDLKCYVSHLAHEYMHQIGFYDERTWRFGTKTKSVPYMVGDIVDKLIGNNLLCAAKDMKCSKQ